jgi:large subunit ribosomal protein L27
MAKTKSGGSSRLGRESRSQRLGIKAYAGEKVKPGMIIVRQRGSKFVPGKNTEIGQDDTIYSLKEGTVNFTTKTKKAFNNDTKKVNVVNVE